MQFLRTGSGESTVVHVVANTSSEEFQHESLLLDFIERTRQVEEDCEGFLLLLEGVFDVLD